jgi:hypothetical protein
MKWIKQTLMAFAAIVVMVSCEYEFIEVVTPEPPDPNDSTVDTVYFSAQIEPIFANSQCLNCHNGSIPPDLRAGNSYNSIVSDGLVTAGDPDASKIYWYPHPVTGTHSTKYSSIDEANLIFSWINQGALNN